MHPAPVRRTKLSLVNSSVTRAEGSFGHNKAIPNLIPGSFLSRSNPLCSGLTMSIRSDNKRTRFPAGEVLRAEYLSCYLALALPLAAPIRIGTTNLCDLSVHNAVAVICSASLNCTELDCSSPARDGKRSRKETPSFSLISLSALRRLHMLRYIYCVMSYMVEDADLYRFFTSKIADAIDRKTRLARKERIIYQTI